MISISDNVSEEHLEQMREHLESKGMFDVFDNEKVMELKTKISTLEKENDKLKTDMKVLNGEYMVVKGRLEQRQRFQWIRNRKVNAWLLCNPALISVGVVALCGEGDVVAFGIGCYVFLWVAVGLDFGYHWLKLKLISKRARAT